MNRPVPYEAFDAGWPLLIVCGACLLFYALFWLTETADGDDPDPLEHEDPTYFERTRPEDQARRNPF